jgi:hypothetical protein
VSDLSKRQFSGATAGLQADMQRALSRLRGDVDGNAVYTPADESQWADPAPDNFNDAINRIVDWLEARHGGDMPIG